MWGVFLPVACCHGSLSQEDEKDRRLSARAHGDKRLTGRHFVRIEPTGGGALRRVERREVRLVME